MSILELIKGVRIYFKANRLVIKHGIWKILAIPGIMSICYILLLVIVGIAYLPDISAYLDRNIIPEFMQGDIMQTVLTVFLWLFLLVVVYISYREIVLILFAPVLSFLSEKVERTVYGREPLPFKLKDLVTDIIRALKLEARSITRMVVLTAIAWLLALIPVAGTVISPVLILLIQSYYGGLRFVDYTLERKRYSVDESLHFAKNNRALITGLGLGFTVLLMIPLLGWFIAPGYGTIAGTLSTLEKININDPGTPGILEL